MENWIINRKQISLEKNKEFSFKIPVLIIPAECEFILERTDSVSEQETAIMFQLRRTKTGAENEKEQVSVFVVDKIATTAFKDLKFESEFLLLSCTANKSIQFTFSINRNLHRSLS